MFLEDITDLTDYHAVLRVTCETQRVLLVLQ